MSEVERVRSKKARHLAPIPADQLAALKIPRERIIYLCDRCGRSVLRSDTSQIGDWLIAVRIPDNRYLSTEGKRRYKRNESGLVVRCPPHITADAIRRSLGYPLHRGKPAPWVQRWIDAAQARDESRFKSETPMLEPYPLPFTEDEWRAMMRRTDNKYRQPTLNGKRVHLLRRNRHTYQRLRPQRKSSRL